jgi:acyl dehydratase
MADLHALHPRGGLYFEDFEVGRVFRHRLTRTVSQMDNLLFSSLTLNPQPLHIDAHFCATETEWGRPLMNSLFTLGLLIGISVNDTTLGTTIANLGMSEVKFPAPLFEGDTVSATTEVTAKRESRSRPDAGVVNSSTARSSRMGRSSPNAAAPPSCGGGRRRRRRERCARCCSFPATTKRRSPRRSTPAPTR